jgi:Holliday junction DNA helicase RuvB
MLTKAAELASILTNLKKGDVLFIDEIHRLSPNIEEVLYSAMEDFVLDIIVGDGASARTIRIDLPRFTLIGATRLGLISNPLRDRFGISCRLNFYELDDLAKLLTRASEIFGHKLDLEGAKEIASRSRGTPRIALRLLKRVRDFAVIENSNLINKKIASLALNKLEVDSQGLDSNDYRYLKFIIDNHNGGPVGIETIAAALAEQRDAIEDAIEPYLIQIGFVMRSKRGRIITEKCYHYLGIENPKIESNIQARLL